MAVDPLEAELRAYELLQWVPYVLPAPYDEDLALEGHYTRLQRQRSDEALDAFDREHSADSSPELTAFRELERLGIFTQNDFYSPSKAANGFYTDLLRRHQQAAIPDRLGAPAISRTRRGRWRTRNPLASMPQEHSSNAQS